MIETITEAIQAMPIREQVAWAISGLGLLNKVVTVWTLLPALGFGLVALLAWLKGD